MGLVLRAGRWYMIYFLQYERREGIFIFAHYIIIHMADMNLFIFRNNNQKRRKLWRVKTEETESEKKGKEDKVEK